MNKLKMKTKRVVACEVPTDNRPINVVVREPENRPIVVTCKLLPVENKPIKVVAHLLP